MGGIFSFRSMFGRVLRLRSPLFHRGLRCGQALPTQYSSFCTQAAEKRTKLSADDVPHPHDFTGGDPIPELREALARGPPRTIQDAISPELEQLTTDMTNLSLVELVQVNHLICKRLGLDPDILAIIRGALQSGGGGSGPAQEEAPAVVDSGFRRVVIREVPAGVKERFPIMKLMRAEDEKLSLADCKKVLENSPAAIFERIDKAKAEDIVHQLEEMNLQAFAELVD